FPLNLLAHFFIDPRHTDNNGRLYLLEHLWKLIKERAISDGDSVVETDVIQMPRGHMGQRQERQVKLASNPHCILRSGDSIGSQVPVAQHYTFGSPGGPRRIDESGNIVRLNLMCLLVESCIFFMRR